MSRIIVIVGPTASGKTYLSINIAKKLNADIISCDSRYLYKEPLIATAKVTKTEMDSVTHHMIDVISLNDDYSIFNYQKDARKILDKLISMNKNIVIVGGSGLYLKALLYNYDLKEVEKSNIDFSSYTNEELKNKLDSLYKNNIHVNNRKRLERAINSYYENDGNVNNEKNCFEKVYDFETIGLKVNRELLYTKINNRVDDMVNEGLLLEANELYKMNFKHFNEIIGYKELIEYFKGNITLDSALEEIKKDTRRYAKRQITWFNNQMPDIKWYDIDYSIESYKKIIDDI